MFKHLTLVLCAGTLLSGCVITTDDPDYISTIHYHQQVVVYPANRKVVSL